MGIKVKTTAYHPQGDGLVERFNKTLLNMLLFNFNGEQRQSMYLEGSLDL